MRKIENGIPSIKGKRRGKIKQYLLNAYQMKIAFLLRYHIIKLKITSLKNYLEHIICQIINRINFDKYKSIYRIVIISEDYQLNLFFHFDLILGVVKKKKV
jgi:hypothetical protein